VNREAAPERQLARLSPRDRHAVESFAEFLRAEGCFCGRDGHLEIALPGDREGLLMCSGCILANVPPIPYATTALAFPGHDDLEACGA
jgi:hypothetical protein